MAWKSGRSLSCLCTFLLLVLVIAPFAGSAVTLVGAAAPGGTPAPATRKPEAASGAAGSWMRISPQPTDRDLSSVFFIDSLTGWTVGEDGAIVKTTDGGCESRVGGFR